MSLGQATAAATATLITTGTNAGKVLIAGGTSATSSTNVAEIYDPATGTGVYANSMAQARYFHTATTLLDGRILIAGGALNGASGGVAQAELYDPVAGTFSPAGTMVTGRFLHTATLLANGSVLVTGGNGAGTTLLSAEIYTPPTTANPSGQWTAVGNMGTARTAHTATLLANGNVLVAGGQDATGRATSSTELFSPASNTFVPGRAMSSARAYHTATASGSNVYLIGGFGATGEVKQSDVFDGALFSAGASLNDARDSHTATLLPNGDILVAGGEDASQLGTTSVEVLSVATGTFVVKTSMSTGRLYHTATLLPNGDVYVTGGLHYSPSFAVLSASEIFDPLFSTPPAMVLASTVENHTATVVSGGFQSGWVLLAGGDSGSAYSPTAATTFFSTVLGTSALGTGPSMITARARHTATALPGGKILMMGGLNGVAPIGSAEVFMPSQVVSICQPPPRRCTLTLTPATFQATAGAPAIARYLHTATYIPSINKVLITGGLVPSAPFGVNGTSEAELYDPTTGTFSATGSMVFDRYAHTATLVSIGGQDKVLITGGWTNAAAGIKNMGAITHSIEIYDPASGTFSMPTQSVSTTSSTWLEVNREYHVATLLSGGQVLFTGGLTSGQEPTATAEVFNPATGRFTLVGNNMSAGRAWHGAALTSLAGGKALVAGGWTSTTGPATASVDIYDPTSNLFAPTAEPLRQARGFHTVTALPDGRILLFGGFSPSTNALTTELSKIMN